VNKFRDQGRRGDQTAYCGS